MLFFHIFLAHFRKKCLKMKTENSKSVFSKPKLFSAVSRPPHLVPCAVSKQVWHLNLFSISLFSLSLCQIPYVCWVYVGCGKQSKILQKQKKSITVKIINNNQINYLNILYINSKINNNDEMYLPRRTFLCASFPPALSTVSAQGLVASRSHPPQGFRFWDSVG